MLDKAIALQEQTMELELEVLGADHPNRLALMFNLSISYEKSGRIDDAVALIEERLRLEEQSLDPDDPQIGKTRQRLKELKEKQ